MIRPELLDGRAGPVRQLARFFRYDHLPLGPLRTISAHSCDLAATMIADLPDSPELTSGLRKLLEAKDCFVRAALPAADDDAGEPAAATG